MHHVSISAYIPNFIEIGETFRGRTNVRTYGRALGHLRPTLLCRLGGVDLKRQNTYLEFHTVTTQPSNPKASENYSPLAIVGVVCVIHWYNICLWGTDGRTDRHTDDCDIGKGNHTWPIEWHHHQCPWMTLKVTFAVWNLSTSHTSWNIALIH